MIQAKATQNREEEMHNAREQAEIARAKADRAYMDAMHLTSDQFIQLKQIEMISEKDDAHLNVIIGADAVPMFNVRWAKVSKSQSHSLRVAFFYA